MNILICGGRDFPLEKVDDFYKYLNELSREVDIDIVIEGGAKGADALAKSWSENRGFHCATVKALWKHYAMGAGPRRNAAMLHLSLSRLREAMAPLIWCVRLVAMGSMLGRWFCELYYFICL